eukprot:CAMPEP_0175370160 /NCGR_PEP_ID=MMETSP0095-20121207/21066_1 /TAXON_ID=311494 /ORGANISM="Alexandrium monilatum, Strain CCMP3105" /LENGTH=237 /DNA_ID=CAMNT_0016668303 /DNA_START=711 /DNA_END=1423 /DNA_ORIENTATION=-
MSSCGVATAPQQSTTSFDATDELWGLILGVPSLDSDACGLKPTKHDACHQGIREHGQVWPLHCAGTEEEGGRRVAAHAVFQRGLGQRGAVLVPAIVVPAWYACRRTGLDKLFAKLLVLHVLLRILRDMKRPIPAMHLRIGGVCSQQALALLEKRQDILITPATATQVLRPMVVVPGIPADVDHVVDGTRTPQALPARPKGYAVVCFALRGRAVRPVAGGVLHEVETTQPAEPAPTTM